MPDNDDEIASLRREIAELRSALSTALALTKVTSELASALSIASDRPQAVLQAFNAIADASDGPLLYSKATDDDLQKVEMMRKVVRMQLQPPLKQS